MFRKIKNFLFNKKIRFNYLTEMGLYNHLSDEKFLKKKYKLIMGKELDLNDPITFNEKLQWLKIHDHNPNYTTMVDKYEAKDYVAGIIGKEYIIPALGVWNHFDDIDFDKLPDKFVLKCTHDSGGIVICHDKNKLDRKAAKKKIEKCLKRNYYWSGREWPYKDVKPRIIAEQYMTDGVKEEIMDYKLLCFNGKQKASFVCSDRFSKDGLKVTFYDTDWEKMPFERHYPSSNVELDKPKSYDEMVNLAEKLAEKIPFVRVDFYEVLGKIYFGELTFSPGSGFEEFNPSEWDKNLGEWIELPENVGGLIYNRGYVIWFHNEVEKILKSDNGLVDYKFYCFYGKPQYLYVSDNLSEHSKAHISFLNMDYSMADFKRTDYNNFENIPACPKNFEKMKKMAMKLSKETKFVRVDFYEIDNQIYFGELTFYPCSGFMPFDPVAYDTKLGEMIKI